MTFAGISISDTIAPVVLSYERNHDPCWPLTVSSAPRSPAQSSVLVSMMPVRPPRPVRGIVMPFNFSLFLMSSGVSPIGCIQT